VRNPVRLKNLKLRFLPVLLAAVLGLVWLQPLPVARDLGLVLIAAGLLLRAWGAGHLVKREQLTVSGPYAHLRHPLYAGTLWICTGFALVLGVPGLGLLAATLVWFFASYFPHKERVESDRLEEIYGGAYASYRARIRPLWPALRAPSLAGDMAGERLRWSAARYADNNELGTLLGVASGIALVLLRAANG